MTTLLLTCRVQNYKTWRPLYDEAISHIPEILTWRVSHGQDDPNFVVMSREFAEGLVNSAEMQQEMGRSRCLLGAGVFP